MNYLIKAQKKSYASKDLIKSVYKIGDAGLMDKIVNGQLSVKSILGVPVYELTDDQVQNITDSGILVSVQDIDTTISGFTSALKDKTEVCKATENTTELSYGKYTFIPFNQLVLPRKYAIQKTLPLVEVAGFKFVAVNAALKDGKNFISA